MAATVKNIKTFALGNTGAMIVGEIAFDNSYPTGGESITIPNAEYVHDLAVTAEGGYTFPWDKSTSAPKVLAYSGSSQVANATDLSALTSVRFRAIVGG